MIFTQAEPDVYKNLEVDYLPNDTDDDIIREIKEKIMNMTEPEKRIFLLWVETGSYSEVARMYNCSSPTVSKYITKVRSKYDI